MNYKDYSHVALVHPPEMAIIDYKSYREGSVRSLFDLQPTVKSSQEEIIASLGSPQESQC
mgnify:FL=1